MAKSLSLISVLVVCFIGVVLASSLNYRKLVNKFIIEDEDRQLFDFLMNVGNKPRATLLGKYVYKNCGDPSKEILVLKNLTLGPDPLSFPGTLTVSFSGSIKSTLDAPLKASVLLQKKVGSTWIKIPCIGQIGSCTYDDLCNLLAGATCPPPFVSAGVPCKCPFQAGNYKLPSASFEVDAAVFPAGDYHASANLTYNGKFVSCVDISATFD